jgi:peptidyl-prolyl cis-trans isomerase SurA
MVGIMTGKMAVVVGLMSLLFVITPYPERAGAQVLDRPVAVVRLTETVNIGQREIRRQVEILEREMGRQLTRANREEVLEAQIGDVLLRQAAERARIRVSDEEVAQAIAVQRQQLGRPVSDAEFRRMIQEQADMSWDEYRDEIRKRLIQERFILERAERQFSEIPEPTAREVRQVYEENAQQFTNPAMARFDHLFFDLRETDSAAEQSARQRANRLARDISRGNTTFQELLRASLDDSTYAGGDFGYLIRGDRNAISQLGRSFVETVLDLEEDQVSGVIESNVGLHIVRITDRRSPRMLRIEDPLLPGERMTVRDQIKAYIVSERQQEIFQDSIEVVLEELKNEAEISRFPQNLNW